MSTLTELWRAGFFGDLATGMVVNLEIAAMALALGLALGLPLGLAVARGGWMRSSVAPVIGLMRAAPTFVVMFFLLNVIPADATLLGIAIASSGPMIVALSLVPYAAAYAADNGSEAWRHWQQGESEAALLFLPNLARAFVVLVMSSSTGAAIGVSEGVAVVLRQAERMGSFEQELLVFAVGIVAFGVLFQTGFLVITMVRQRLVGR